MSLSTAIANTLWVGASLPGLAAFERALRRPEAAQARLLARLVRRNTPTAYGRTHGFGTIKDYRDFARQVPVVDYDSVEPWIARIAAGETAVLTLDPVTRLMPTGGSTGGRKLIPFTAGLQAEFNAAIGPWIGDIQLRYRAPGWGSSYWSITPAVPSPEGKGSVVPVGFEDDASYLGGARRRIVNGLMAVPPDLRLVRDTEEFKYLTVLCLIRRGDLRLISVWHPSFLGLLLDALAANWSDLLRDVRRGGCRYREAVPASIMGTLLPAPKRASQLQDANSSSPATIWPGLRMISCWGDGHAAGALEELKRRFPGVMFQSKGLLATEAFVTIPYRGGFPLAIRSHFFEFRDDAGGLHLASGLVEGAEYEVVVTTGGGLYRYRLGDRVKVTGLLAATPCMKFLGRTGNQSDLFGEKLSEAFAGQAIQEATRAHRAPPRFAMLAPEAASEGVHYTLFFEGVADAGLPERLDQALKQNPHYRYCRDLGQLRAPTVFWIEAGGFETFARREVLRGRRLGDIKPSPLSSWTDWAHHFQRRPETMGHRPVVR